MPALDVNAIERLIARLELETFHEHQGDTFDRAYRKGHNDRTRSLIATLRMEAGLLELAEAPASTTDDLGDIAARFDTGGES